MSFVTRLCATVSRQTSWSHLFYRRQRNVPEEVDVASFPDDTDVLVFLRCPSTPIKLTVGGESSKAPAPTRARRKRAIVSKKRILDHAPPCRSDSREFLGKVLK